MGKLRMKLIDANIILYSSGVPHPYKRACASILREAARRSEEYALDAEVLQETLHVMSRRSRRADGVSQTRDLLETFKLIIPIGQDEINTATDFFERYPFISARDAIHAAVVVNHNMEGIISTDKGFDRVAELRRFDPIDLAGA
jgi:predicted nucleic acid-binding protein